MLKSFQLKAARSVTGIEVREVGLYLGISRTIISRWEKQDPHDAIYSKKSSIDSLFFFFEQHNIVFPDQYSICYKSNTKPTISNSLNRFQFRAARSCLRLTQDELAILNGTTRSIVNYIEIQDNYTFLDKINKDININSFKLFFTKNNLVFPDSNTISYMR